MLDQGRKDMVYKRQAKIFKRNPETLQGRKITNSNKGKWDKAGHIVLPCSKHI
jgi:hypothetical protein